MQRNTMVSVQKCQPSLCDGGKPVSFIFTTEKRHRSFSFITKLIAGHLCLSILQRGGDHFNRKQMVPMPCMKPASARGATFKSRWELSLRTLRFIISQPTPLVTINLVLTSDRAYVCSCFCQETSFLRAFRRIRAIARLIGGRC